MGTYSSYLYDNLKIKSSKTRVCIYKDFIIFTFKNLHTGQYFTHMS